MGENSTYGNRLSRRAVAEIKFLIEEGDYVSLRDIAKQYGCSDVLIGKIKRKEYWKEIEPKRPNEHEERPQS